MMTEERLAELMFGEIEKHNLYISPWYVAPYVIDGFQYCVRNKLNAAKFLNTVIRKKPRLIKLVLEYISKNADRFPEMKTAIDELDLGKLLVLV